MYEADGAQNDQDVSAGFRAGAELNELNQALDRHLGGINA